MWWFTADQHFGHFAIINHADRPFKTDIEMDEHMIEAWNIHVKPADVVVIAGDWALITNAKMVHNKYTNRLKGNKIFIRGNHDYWMKEKRHMYHRTIEGQGIAVAHYPMRTWKNKQHGWWNLHGHTHGTLEPFRNQLDVGVDVAYRYFGEYRPFAFDEIEEILNDQRKGR